MIKSALQVKQIRSASEALRLGKAGDSHTLGVRRRQGRVHTHLGTSCVLGVGL